MVEHRGAVGGQPLHGVAGGWSGGSTVPAVVEAHQPVAHREPDGDRIPPAQVAGQAVQQQDRRCVREALVVADEDGFVVEGQGPVAVVGSHRVTAPGPVLAGAGRGTRPVSSLAVGWSMTSGTSTDVPKRCSNRTLSSAASRECPPTSKKSSSAS